MLHHCNVDRLATIWQAIHHEDVMFTGTGYSTGQFATSRDTPITADSPLKPFFNGNMSFHTSNSVANISAFGYTYPEIPDWVMPPEARADYVRAYVNALYSHGANGLGQTQTVDKLGVAESKNYYTAEIVIERSEVPLPLTVGLAIEGKAVAHMSMLAMPHEGLASVSLPLQDILIRNQSLKDLPRRR
jgi:tyrosinase